MQEKCVEKLMPIHEAQLLTYMKLANVTTGLLINFNEKMLKRGIKRFVMQSCDAGELLRELRDLRGLSEI